jgi:undecaprenyl-diphosphatase
MAFETLNRLDFPIDHWLNGHFGKHAAFDGAIGFVSGSALINGALILGLFWWSWHKSSDPAARRRDREHVVATLFAGAFAFFLARMLVIILPFRVRPRLEPALHFVLPAGWNGALSTDWSSFPCDNAMMFIALAVGLCFVSRAIGVLAIVFVLAVNCFPPVYMGMHYPSDVLVGLVLGAVLGCLLNVGSAPRRIAGPVLRCEARWPGGFYAVLFLFSFEAATQFTSVRSILQGVAHVAQKLVGLR